MVIEPPKPSEKEPQWRGFPDPLKGVESEIEKENQPPLKLDQLQVPNMTVSSWSQLAGVISGTRASHYRYKSAHATTGNFLEGGRFFPAIPNPGSQDRPSPGTGVWRVFFYRKEGEAGEHTTTVPLRTPGGELLDVVVDLNGAGHAAAIVPRQAGGPQEWGGIMPSAPQQQQGTPGAGVFLAIFESQQKIIHHQTEAAKLAYKDREETIKTYVVGVEERLQKSEKKRKKLARRLRKAEERAGGIGNVLGSLIQENPEAVGTLITSILSSVIGRPIRASSGHAPDEDESRDENPDEPPP